MDWGAKSVKGDKNARSLVRAEGLIALYQPDVLVLPDASSKNSRRSSRIKELVQAIMDLANSRQIKVAMLSPEQVKRHLLAGGEGTKHTVAEIIAQRFEAELGPILPPKRSLWKSEDRRMDIFGAVALASAFRLKGTRTRV